MVSIYLSCTAGTHEIGVETMSHADSNGLSFDPATEYATSVGRGQGYVARAEVLLHSRPDCAPPLVYFHEQSGALTLGAREAHYGWVYRAVQAALTPEGVAISSLLSLKQARPRARTHINTSAAGSSSAECPSKICKI